MKKLIFTSIAILTFGASYASASTDSNFTMKNENFETKVCYVAATEGLDTAKQLVSNKGLSFRKFNQNVTCNDKSLTAFAKQYAEAKIAGKPTSKVTLVAENNDLESKICLESLVHGIPTTAKKYKINSDYIRCNGKPLPRFVKESKQRGATVASLPE